MRSGSLYKNSIAIRYEGAPAPKPPRLRGTKKARGVADARARRGVVEDEEKPDVAAAVEATANANRAYFVARIIVVSPDIGRRACSYLRRTEEERVAGVLSERLCVAVGRREVEIRLDIVLGNCSVCILGRIGQILKLICVRSLLAVALRENVTERREAISPRVLFTSPNTRVFAARIRYRRAGEAFVTVRAAFPVLYIREEI